MFRSDSKERGGRHLSRGRRTPDRCVRIRLLHAYEFSITAKTATTAARTLKKMQERTVLRGNRQSTQECANERKSNTAPASQAYSAAPCRVAIVHHRFLACTLSIRQRLPRKNRNVPPAIPYVSYVTSTRTVQYFIELQSVANRKKLTYSTRTSTHSDIYETYEYYRFFRIGTVATITQYSYSYVEERKKE